MAPGAHAYEEHIDFNGDTTASWRIDKPHRLVDFPYGTDVVFLDENGIKRHDGKGEQRWATAINESFSDAPGLAWSATTTQGYHHTLEPFVVNDANPM